MCVCFNSFQLIFFVFFPPTVSSRFITRALAAEASVPQMLSSEQLPNENLSTALDQKIVSPNRLLADTGSFARVIVGFPDLVVRTQKQTGESWMVMICFWYYYFIPKKH